MESKKVWFVTGASKGLGLALVMKLLADGYKVAATSRSLIDLNKAIGEQSTNLLHLQVDLINEQSVSKAISETIEKFGKIDVVVNNAGYGQFGTVEELTDQEARQNFDINVFGSLNVIRNVLPHLRSQKSGHVINISSIGGLLGSFPGWGIYCASKFAVAGFTESLASESKEFGISATVVYPGYFRTDFLSTDSMRLPQNAISAYTEARNSEAMHVNQIPGNQPGDPVKAAIALIELADAKNPALHLFLGSDSLELAKNKIEVLQNELNANEALTMSTDFAK